MTISEQIAVLTPLMPLEVLQDVNQRIIDYLATGGDPEGPYIEQQLRYMKHVAHAKEMKRLESEES